MNLPEKIRQIAAQLLERSRANQVNWTKERDSEEYPHGFSVPVERASVRFPHSSFRLSYGKPHTEFNYIKAAIVRADDLVVGELVATEDSAEDWPLLLSLWQESQRCLTGWDDVLSDIEEALTAAGPIGLGANENQETNR